MSSLSVNHINSRRHSDCKKTKLEKLLKIGKRSSSFEEEIDNSHNFLAVNEKKRFEFCKFLGLIFFVLS